MDKEQLKAYTAVRERIANEIDNIIANGGSPNDLKRLRRYGSSFGWYPEFYPEVLANHGEMTTKQLIGALRGPEEKIMKDLVPIKGMPLHHAVANRTGGDAAFRAPVDVWLETRDRLIQKYQREFGNSGINLNPSGAVDERMHQGRRGSKGTVFDPKLGYGADPVADLPILHGMGQKNIGEAIGRASAGASADDLFNQLDPIVNRQIQDLDIVLNNPTNVAQRQVVTDVAPDAFSPNATPAQQAAVRNQMVETGTDIRFAQAFDPELGRLGELVSKNGVIRLAKSPAVRRLAALAPVVGTSVGALTVEANAASRAAEIEANPNDPTLQVNRALDYAAGYGDRLSVAGMATTATGIGAIPGLAMTAAGEGLSLIAGLTSLAIDGGRAGLKFITDQTKDKDRSDMSMSSGAMK